MGTRRALIGVLLVMAWGCSPPEGGGISEEDEPRQPCASFWDCPSGQLCGEDGFCLDGEAPQECVDEDGDGFGVGCQAGEDCDDGDPFRNPRINEICNGVDDDCDFVVDEEQVCDQCEDQCEPGARECVSDTAWRECRRLNGCAQWLPLSFCEVGCVDGACEALCDDFDGDGFGVGCEAGEDCDDRNPFSFPGNTERCDGYDNDCDGQADEGGICDETCEDECDAGARRCQGDARFEVCTVGPLGCRQWSASLACSGGTVCQGGFCEARVECVDNDGDGFGPGCDAGLDCDDLNDAIHPGIADACDGIDNDCDGIIDGGGANCGAAWCGDNDRSTPGSARTLEAGQTASGYTCQGRVEFHRLGRVEAGRVIVVNAQRPEGGAPLTVALRRGDTEVARRVGDPAVAFAVAAPAAGDYTVQISGADGEPYALAWTDDRGTCQGTNGVEPNNSPAQRVASLLPGAIVRDSSCAGDLDFFQVPTLGRGQVLSVDLAGTSADRLLLEIWRDGVLVTPDQARPDQAAHAHFRAALPGSYAVAVRGINPRVESAYLLSASIQTLGCTDDGHAGDDTIATAAPINRAEIGGTICPGDLDYLRLGPRVEGDMVDVRITFDANAANLDAFLLRDDLNGLLQVALTDGSPERLPTRIPRAGTYYVLVMGRAPHHTVRYTLAR